MKIPFDIKYRPEIESGRYKVVTGTGLPVEIVHWDLSLRRKPILAVISYVGGKRDHRYDPSGLYYGPGYSFLLTGTFSSSPTNRYCRSSSRRSWMPSAIS